MCIRDSIKDPDAIQKVFDGALRAIEAIAKIIPPVIAGLEWVASHLPGQKGMMAGAAAAAGGAIGGLPGAALAGGTVAYAQARHEEHDQLTSRGYSEHDANRFLGKFKEGGPINEDGIAQVHAGEFVVPAGGALVRGSGGGHSIDAPITINVHVEGGEGMTEDGLSLKLSELLPNALIPAREQLASTIGAA